MVDSITEDEIVLKIFMSYASDDADLFKVPEIAKKLQFKPGIGKTFYW